MFKKLLSVSILFYLVSVSAHAQENNSMLTMGMMLVSTPRKSIRNSLFPKNLEEGVSNRFSLQTFRIRDIFTSG